MEAHPSDQGFQFDGGDDRDGSKSSSWEVYVKFGGNSQSSSSLIRNFTFSNLQDEKVKEIHQKIRNEEEIKFELFQNKAERIVHGVKKQNEKKFLPIHSECWWV